MNNYNSLYSPDVVRDLTALEEKINEEKGNPEANKSKIAKLRAQQFYRGLELSTGFVRTNNKQPY